MNRPFHALLPAASRVAVSLSLVISLALLAPFAAGPAAAQGANPAVIQPRPPSITVAKVERRDITASVLVSGNVVARDEVLVVPEVDGLAVQEILAEEGDMVKAGQVLARLNRAALDVALAQNTAALQRVTATIAQARAQITDAEAVQRMAERYQRLCTIWDKARADRRE